MSDTGNELPKPKRISLRRSLTGGTSGGSRQTTSDPLEVTGSGDVLGLGIAETLDEDGHPIKNTFHAGSLPKHQRQPLSQQPRN